MCSALRHTGGEPRGDPRRRGVHSCSGARPVDRHEKPVLTSTRVWCAAPMRFTTYADLFRIPAVCRILVLGLVIRIPLWAANIVLTPHVVQHLDRSYTQAGLLEMVYSLALAVS